jgi:phage terminase large subunit GpA-like protein
LISERAFFEQLVDALPADPPPASISEYVQGRRILPSSTPFPGLWDNARTPYLVEPMDCLSPSSPVQHVVLMAGAQTGKTAAAENACSFFMDACPTEILFATATEDLAEDWSTKRLDPLIDSLGFRAKISATVENRKVRRSGDKTFSKTFMGGSINIVSAQSAASLRSASKRVLIRDEIDGAPQELRTGEGNWLDVSEARTNAWGPRKKIFDVSTPKTFETSLINRLFEMGDARSYLVPCPHCGRDQELAMGNEQAQHGMKGIFDKSGTLIEAVYLCEFCHKQIRNHQKTAMLARGHWQPTKQSVSPAFRSYHLSSLYSPVGMLSWTDLFQKFLNARGDSESMRAFTNLYLGLPFKETGSRPDLKTVIALRGTYRAGTIPGRMVGDRWQGPLFLVAGVDVQRGKEKDDTLGPRLEMEVLGIGAGYRTWSILYKVFPGAVDDPFGGAWEDLNTFARNGGILFPQLEVIKTVPSQLGRNYPPSFTVDPLCVSTIFVDSGDQADVVYRFCHRWENTLPCKGLPYIIPDPKKREHADIPGSAFKKYRVASVGGGETIIEVNTRFWKRILYGNLKIPRQPTEPQSPGFCDFPFDYDEEYFAELTAEELRSDGAFHKIRGRNEALDARVYALCAGELFLDNVVKDYQNAARVQGASLVTLQTLNTRWVLENMAASMRPKTAG